MTSDFISAGFTGAFFLRRCEDFYLLGRIKGI